jgi:hypothetical protein
MFVDMKVRSGCRFDIDRNTVDIRCLGEICPPELRQIPDAVVEDGSCVKRVTLREVATA